MKRRDTDVEEIVETHLGLFRSPPSQEMAHAEQRALRRLRSEAASLPEGSTDHSGARPLRWGWRLAAAGAAAAALFVLVAQPPAIRNAVGRVLWNPAIDAYAVVETADGLYRASGQAVRTGETVAEGEPVRTNGGAGAMLALADGSRVEMRSQSELALEPVDDGLRIRLHKGGIIVNAAKQGTGHLYVQTKDVTVSVVGTVFLVNADREGSRVAVIEGEVRVRQGAAEKKLLPGEQMVTGLLMAPQLVRDEISWSRNARTHITLLQQATSASRNAVTEARAAFEVVSVRPTAAPAAAGERGGGSGVRRRNPRPADEPCGSSNEPVLDPRRFDASDTTVVALTLWAYGLDCTLGRGSDLLLGGPTWIKNDGFDVLAVIPDGAPSYTRDELVAHRAPKLQAMLQTMLAEQFKLELHREMKEMPVYVLTVAEGGPRYIASSTLKRAAPIVQPGGRVLHPPGFGDPNPRLGMSVWREGDDTCCQSVGPGLIEGKKKSMAWLAGVLTWQTGRPVLDRTGLTGEFNYQVTFESGRPMPPGFPTDSRTVFAALQEEFGLKLESAKERMEVLVIDRVEKPLAN